MQCRRSAKWRPTDDAAPSTRQLTKRRKDGDLAGHCPSELAQLVLLCSLLSLFLCIFIPVSCAHHSEKASASVATSSMTSPTQVFSLPHQKTRKRGIWPQQQKPNAPDRRPDPAAHPPTDCLRKNNGVEPSLKAKGIVGEMVSLALWLAQHQQQQQPEYRLLLTWQRTKGAENQEEKNKMGVDYPATHRPPFFFPKHLNALPADRPTEKSKSKCQ